MNWDRLKAKDLLALFSSFKPKEGVVLSVTVTITSCTLSWSAVFGETSVLPLWVWLVTCVCQIYPSEFGKERMSAEQTQGPLELTGLPENPDTDTEEQRYCFHDSYRGLDQDLQWGQSQNALQTN